MTVTDGQGGALRKTLHPAGWTRDADCLGRSTGSVDPWFPDEDLPKVERDLQLARARVVCASCPVRYACAVEALEAGDAHGMRGGLTPEERRPIALTYGWPDPKAAPCGTRSKYVAGCRCADCRRANTAWARERRATGAWDPKARAAEEAAMKPRERVLRVLGRQRRPMTAREVYRLTGVKVWRVRVWAAEAEAAEQLTPGRLVA